MKKLILFAIALLAIGAGFYFSIEAGAITSMATMALGPIASKMSSRDLEYYAKKNFSSMDGDEDPDNYDNEEEFYSGYDDDFLDFGGKAQSFADSMESGRKFIITITNSTGNSSTRTMYLTPGLSWAPGQIAAVTSVTTATGSPLVYTTTNTNVYASGPMRDGAFLDKDGNAGLSGSGSPKTLALFLAYIYYHPTQISGMKIQATEASQIDQQFIIRPQDPFKTAEESYITPGAYQNQDTYRDKIIMVPTTGLVLSKDVQIEYPVLGNTSSNTVSITLFVGASFSTHTAMTKKVATAARTFSRVGAANVKKFQQLAGSRMNLGKGRR